MSGIFDVLGKMASSKPASSPSVGGTGGTSILMQAVGAAMRGESATDFMKRLATQHPQLKELNLDDLQGTATTLCQQQGKDINQLAEQVNGMIGSVVNK